jgi:hypothetical protein
MVSSPNVAFNAYGNSDGTTTGSIYVLDSVFDIDSGYFTAAWNDGLQITALGFRGGTLTYSNTYTLSTTSPTLINFNYDGIDSVHFISFGGTPHDYGGGGGTQAVFDNLEVTVPEPATITMLLFGTVLLYGVTLRSTFANKSPEPTAVGAFSSAVAVHVADRRWLSFLR